MDNHLATEIPGVQLETVEKIGNKTPTDVPNYDRLSESMDFKFKFNNVIDRVKSIIKQDKYARKNYLWLDIMYYAKMGMLTLISPLEDFSHANSPETINRAFRKLIEQTSEGLHPDLNYLLEDEIRNFRERKKQKENFDEMFELEKNSKKAVIIK